MPGRRNQHMAGRHELLRSGCLLFPCFALLVGLLGADECLARDKKVPATVIVRMTDGLRFKPARVVVHAGDTVEWKNSSTAAHTVTADARRAAEGKEVVLPAGAAPFDSGTVTPGNSYRHTFTAPGTYKYICVPHVDLGMVGEIIVQPRPTASSHPRAEAPQKPQHEAMEDHHTPDMEKAGGWPSGLGGEIIRWLGKFHPPAANFPIALLVAAALAEILFAATGRPVFDAANRFSL